MALKRLSQEVSGRIRTLENKVQQVAEAVPALKKCPDCGELTVATADLCDCGFDFRTRQSRPRTAVDTFAAVIGLAGGALAIWYYFLR